MSETFQTGGNSDWWEPAIPLPFVTSRWFGLSKRYVCFGCSVFKSERSYEAHYRAVHVSALRDALKRTRGESL